MRIHAHILLRSLRSASKAEPRKVWSALTTAGLGLVFLVAGDNAFRLGSYDVLAGAKRRFVTGGGAKDALIFYLDEKTFSETGEAPEKIFPPKYFESFLDRVFAGTNSPAVVAFDLVFDDPRTEYEGLGRAMAGRRVVVARSVVTRRLPMGTLEFTQRLPAECVRTQALVGFGDFSSRIVRSPWVGTNPVSLARQAAGLIPRVRLPEAGVPLWLDFYGPPGSIESLSFVEWTNNVERLKDKLVFVGRSEVLTTGGVVADRHRVPGAEMFGVEIHATAALNLVHGHWVTELGVGLEVVLVVGLGLVLGFVAVPMPRRRQEDATQAVRLRRGAAGVLRKGAVAAGIALGVAVVVFATTRVWVPWLVFAGAQVPCACAWGLWSVIATRNPRYDFFISYRRIGGREIADDLENRLESAGFEAFKDASDVGTGRFDASIPAILEQAPVFVLVVTEGTFEGCQREEDWVRREIRLALRSGRHIVPLLDKGVEGAGTGGRQECVMPTRESLPADIADVVNFNALKYAREPYLREGVVKALTEALRT